MNEWEAVKMAAIDEILYSFLLLEIFKKILSIIFV